MRTRILSLTCMGLLLAALQAKGQVTEAAVWVIFVAVGVLVVLHESFARAEMRERQMRATRNGSLPNAAVKKRRRAEPVK